MELYKTRDLELAATLQCLGHKIIKLEDHPNKVNTKKFVFQDEPNKEGNKPSEDAELYLPRKLKVEPNTLFHNTANLREWVKGS